eukprot:Colp12_sorted_trinity150504_noHs@10560
MVSLRNLHKHTDELDLEVGPGGVEEERIRQQTSVKPHALLNDGLGVAERRESGLAVVGAHAGLSDTTERQVRVACVEESGVDRDTAGTCVVDDELLGGLAGREDVQGKGLGARTHVGDGLAHVLHSNNQKDRAKSFLLEGLVTHGAVEDAGGNVPLALVEVPSVHKLALGRLQHPLKTLHLRVTDDTANGLSLLWVLTVEGLDVVGALLVELLHNALLHKAVIGRNALLSCIHHSAPDSALCSEIKVSVRSNEHGVLAAKLKRARCQVLGSRLGNHLSDRGATSEEDVVELGFEQLTSALAISTEVGTHHLHDVGIHVLGDQLSEEMSNVLGHHAGLEDHSVAGSDSAQQRKEGQHNGVVPCADDENDTERLLVDKILTREAEEAEALLFRQGPLRKILNHSVEIVEGNEKIVESCLELGAAKISLDCSNKLLLIFNKKTSKCLQLFDALRKRAGVATLKRLPHFLNDISQLFELRILIISKVLELGFIERGLNVVAVIRIRSCLGNEADDLNSQNESKSANGGLHEAVGAWDAEALCERYSKLVLLHLQNKTHYAATKLKT